MIARGKLTLEEISECCDLPLPKRAADPLYEPVKMITVLKTNTVTALLYSSKICAVTPFG